MWVHVAWWEIERGCEKFLKMKLCWGCKYKNEMIITPISRSSSPIFSRTLFIPHFPQILKTLKFIIFLNSPLSITLTPQSLFSFPPSITLSLSGFLQRQRGRRRAGDDARAAQLLLWCSCCYCGAAAAGQPTRDWGMTWGYLLASFWRREGGGCSSWPLGGRRTE